MKTTIKTSKQIKLNKKELIIWKELFRFAHSDTLSNCITSNKSIESFILDDYKIRRLTPRECMR